MNNDLISRSALLEEFDWLNRACANDGANETAAALVKLVENAPAVDAEVVRHEGKMTDSTINGRTPEEIKKKLEPCKNANCSACYNEYSCKIEADALAYIQQLEADNARLQESYDAMAKDVERFKRERDAALTARPKEVKNDSHEDD